MHGGPILAYYGSEDGYVGKYLDEQTRMLLQHTNSGNKVVGSHLRIAVNKPSKLLMKLYTRC